MPSREFTGLSSLITLPCQFFLRQIFRGCVQLLEVILRSLRIIYVDTEKNDFVTETKLGTPKKFFVAPTKNFAAATKRFVDRAKHFDVVTKYFCYPYFNK